MARIAGYGVQNSMPYPKGTRGAWHSSAASKVATFATFGLTQNAFEHADIHTANISCKGPCDINA